MRESLFIKKNLERWKRYQEQPTDDPDEMAERFTTLLDDLAYAKTFYSGNSSAKYINSMAAVIYRRIYSSRSQPGRIRRFFQYELPLLFARYHRLFLFTFCYFLLFCIIAAFSAAHDETFVRGVMGDEYVNMTERNITAGDPFGVYGSENEWLMWVRIAYNNIQVAIYCFIAGIFLSAGTLWLLTTNGIMLGSFQYYFFAKGLGMQSVLTIWIHGTLEISAIVIAGTAGLVLGNSLLFPGTHKRVDSLKRGARDGIKIIISLVPIFIAAAFLESFITRNARSMPIWMSAIILGGSLALIVWYFIIYPIKLKRAGFSLNADGKPQRVKV
ncbi:stage II sporulation protein M [Chitinophaga horti]|uniref:Stage II sporulation protein M n=1 Tax=Chitinophaga horti TaxID=2920382 RepID=A0ABY6IZ13_9BACT|nr:stage II sporulation protein M [Chitinophaga horti]UYQ92615.1 stage II sporulation protein M [Chitinophaga horti]